MRRYAVATALLLLTAHRSACQSTAAAVLVFGGIDKLLERVESINIYYGGAIKWSKQPDAVTDYRLPWKRNYGLEFSLHVGDYGDFLPEVKKRRENEQRELLRALVRRPTAGDSADTEAKSAAPKVEVTGITVKKHLTVTGKDTVLVAVDSELVGAPSSDNGLKLWEFDLGIGYGQLEGILAADPHEVRGYIRELPSVTLYATRRLTPRLSAYVGARTGVVSLQDTQLYLKRTADSTSIFTLSATSFEVGVPVGMQVDLTANKSGKNVVLTVEGSYTRRYFSSVTSNPATGLVADFPHSIRLPSWGIDVGLQFPIPKASK
jgi:hypothetical protein